VFLGAEGVHRNETLNYNLDVIDQTSERIWQLQEAMANNTQASQKCPWISRPFWKLKYSF